MKRYILLCIIIQLCFSTFSFSQVAESDSAQNKVLLVTVETFAGDIFKGQIIKQDSSHLHLQTHSVGELKILLSSIKSINYTDSDETLQAKKVQLHEKTDEPIKQHYYNENRYFISTSAFSLKRNQKLVRNNPMSFEYGLTDNWTVGVGTSLYALFYEASFSQFNLKYTYRINEIVGLKGSTNFFLSADGSEEDNYLYSIFNAGITLGIPTLNFTINYFYGNAFELFESRNFYSLAGSIRLSKYFGVVTDNFVYNEDGRMNYISFHTLRISGKQASVDGGFMLNSDFNSDLFFIAIPVVGISVLLD